jgi:hypothetical protein
VRAIEAGEAVVEGSEWKMTGFTGQFEKQTVRKSERWFGAE